MQRFEEKVSSSVQKYEGGTLSNLRASENRGKDGKKAPTSQRKLGGVRQCARLYSLSLGKKEAQRGCQFGMTAAKKTRQAIPQSPERKIMEEGPNHH